MASIVEIILKATDQASAVLNNVKNIIVQYSTKINDVSRALTGLDASVFATTTGIKILVDEYRKAIDETMEYAKQVRTLSRDIGGSPEEISKLIQAADDAQVSFEQLKTAMIMANKQGTNVTIEGLQKLADQYLAIQDPLQRTKFLTDTFGRSGESMGAFMEMGGEGIRAAGEEAEKYGRILDEQAIAETEDYRLAVDGLQDSLSKLSDDLALDVIPALTDMLAVITPVINAYNDFKGIIDKIPDAIKPLIMQLDMMLNPIKAVTGPLYYVIDGFKELLKLSGKKVGVTTTTTSTVGQTSRGSIYETTSASRGSIYAESRDVGGAVYPDSPYMIGKGPYTELFIPDKKGTVIPHNQLNDNQNSELLTAIKMMPRMVARELRQLEKYG